MSFFQRTEDFRPEGFEDVVGELVESIRRSFTGVVVDHLEDLLAVPPRHMCLVDRHLSITEDDRDYTIHLLLFHVIQMRYIAIQVQAGRFDPALVARTRYTLDLVDDLVRVPEAHRSSVGVLLCTDGPADKEPGPVAITLYDDVTPAEQAELPLALELTAVIDRCLDTRGAPPSAAP
ncbi:PDDEXK nuclease domain-containing protein [Promicromonospora aerolata]|uniref:PDDEXK nuclease domain-containing protein n=1 Tax=Promicromonospora aerolata TaxID=195749 RepID=A0ABW4VCM7_9MICO